jgi:phenylacetate-CoA ligase
MIWNEKIECMGREELKNVQSERLCKLVKNLASDSQFYQKRFVDAGVDVVAIKTIDDLKKLPFTVKEDLRDNYPFGIFSRDIKEIAEVHVSSGTTGNPTVVGYTKEDLKLWSDVMARTLAVAGAEPGDMLQVAYGYGLFTGGLGLHYGGLELGMTVLPMSSGQTKRQLKLMQDFKPRVLACTPSYALYMVDEATEMGIDPRSSSWEIGIFGAEPWSDSMRDELEKTWNILATDIYGLSEIIGPGVAQECKYKNGLHVFSDVFYPEIIDSNTGEEVSEGEEGELVFTTLTKAGMPLIRYRTRDIVTIDYTPCACGRTSPRISKIKGRTDDMIIVRGINIFPSQVEHVLVGIDGIEPHYQIIVDRQKTSLDDLEVHVEVSGEIFSDGMKTMKIMEDRIRSEIASVLGIMVRVKLVEPRSIERSMGKAKRVIDKREL